MFDYYYYYYSYRSGAIDDIVGIVVANSGIVVANWVVVVAHVQIRVVAQIIVRLFQRSLKTFVTFNARVVRQWLVTTTTILWRTMRARGGKALVVDIIDVYCCVFFKKKIVPWRKKIERKKLTLNVLNACQPWLKIFSSVPLLRGTIKLFFCMMSSFQTRIASAFFSPRGSYVAQIEGQAT